MQNRFYNDKPSASVTDWGRWNYQRWWRQQQQRQRWPPQQYGYEDAYPDEDPDEEEEPGGGKFNRLEEGSPPHTKRC